MLYNTPTIYKIGGETSESNIFAIDPTKIDDYIDITSEWEFYDNTWNDLYNDVHTLKILFSQKYELVYFDKNYRNGIYRTTQISPTGWNRGLRYVGNRFWVSPYAESATMQPSKAFWQGYLFTGVDNANFTTLCIGDITYTGDPGKPLTDCGLGFKQKNGLDLNNTYGFMLQGLCLDVTLK